MTYVEQLGRNCWKDFHIWVQWEIGEMNINRFIETICQHYPCVTCRRHFTDLIQNVHPCKGEPDQYLFYVHNLVNKSQGKKMYPIQVLEQYQTPQAKQYYELYLKHVDWKERLHHNHEQCLPFKLRLPKSRYQYK